MLIKIGGISIANYFSGYFIYFLDTLLTPEVSKEGKKITIASVYRLKNNHKPPNNFILHF